MKILIGAILLLLGIVYVVGAIFHKMMWMFARAFSSGIMLLFVAIGLYLILSSLFKKGSKK